jgi:glycosyltransferase involved in cell wall biosynthesis
MTTTFSIVTISFNQAEFIERTILSVLQQAEAGIEYIIVDPGSTDGSRDIIERYRGRISKIIYDEDAGPADGLNKGFSCASGEWYGYINSDDFYLPGGIASAAIAARRYGQAGAIVGNGYLVDSNDNVLKKSVSTRFSLFEALHGACFSLQQSTFYRADAFWRAGGFNIQNNTCWDGEILFELARAGYPIERFYANVGAFRIHSQSITGSGRLNQQYLRDVGAIFERTAGRRRTDFDRFMTGPCVRAWARLKDPRRNLDLALDRWRRAGVAPA